MKICNEPLTSITKQFGQNGWLGNLVRIIDIHSTLVFTKTLPRSLSLPFCRLLVIHFNFCDLCIDISIKSVICHYGNLYAFCSGFRSKHAEMVVPHSSEPFKRWSCLPYFT
jgi:hypothetical protein